MQSKIKSAEDIQGFEYDWLASDENGLVAFFSTAGAGYAPAPFLRDIDAHTRAIDLMLSMPAFTTAKFSPVIAINCVNTWQQMAERGFYAYDCDPNGGPYRLVAKPENPIRVCSLPPVVSAVCTALRLSLRFDDLSQIHSQMIGNSE